VQFYVTKVSGAAPPAHLQGRKDVVLVMPMDSVSFITRFEHYADTVPYMYHCHLLHHEDDGMMLAFIVLDTTATDVEELQGGSLRLYPNPADGYLQAWTDMQDVTVSVSDLTGKILHVPCEKRVDGLVLSTSILGNGIYLMSLKTLMGIVHRKFMINR
jgi:blue copper oxidase